MRKSTYDAAAGVYRALIDVAILTAAGTYSVGRRGHRRASGHVRSLRETYGPRTATAYRALRGDLPAPRRGTALIVTVTLVAGAAAGAGAAITALWVRRTGAAEPSAGMVALGDLSAGELPAGAEGGSTGAHPLRIVRLPGDEADETSGAV